MVSLTVCALQKPLSFGSHPICKIQIQSKNPDTLSPQSLPGFILSLAPMDGALAAEEQLRKGMNNEVYILTAPSTRNPLSYTEKTLGR